MYLMIVAICWVSLSIPLMILHHFMCYMDSKFDPEKVVEDSSIWPYAISGGFGPLSFLAAVFLVLIITGAGINRWWRDENFISDGYHYYTLNKLRAKVYRKQKAIQYKRAQEANLKALEKLIEQEEEWLRTMPAYEV